MYQSDQFSDLSVDEADELNSITIETCKGIMDISDGFIYIYIYIFNKLL